MARFRKMYHRARSYGKRTFRRHTSGGGENLLGTGLSAAGYGATRAKIHSFIPNLGMAYSDNLISAGLAFLGAKKGSGLVKTISKGVFYGECFASGMEIGAPLIGGSRATTGSSTVYGGFV